VTFAQFVHKDKAPPVENPAEGEGANRPVAVAPEESGQFIMTGGRRIA
jgi:hypothetical protein